MKLTDFKVLTFDCYGTLIDWESGMLAALQPLLSRVQKTLARDEVLAAHARHESAQQLATPAKRYSELLAVGHKRLSEEWGVPPDWAECVAYGQSIRNWPAFPDSAAALQYLKLHYKLVILSNVDNESFAFSNRKLGVEFDAIFTAEDIGSYKPSPRNFEYMLEKLATYGIPKGEILHTAESLFHDHKSANDFGLASCWIHRRHAEGGLRRDDEPERDAPHRFPLHQHGRICGVASAAVDALRIAAVAHPSHRPPRRASFGRGSGGNVQTIIVLCAARSLR